MKQRYTFQCHHCSKTYTLLRDISKQQTLVVACPYCNQDAVVDLAPFRKKIKPVQRGSAQEPDVDTDLDEAWDLPATLPTKKPE